jgi:hypothetical protein
MALNYDLTEIKGYKRKVYAAIKSDSGETRYKMKHIPETIVFLTMSVGMREITEKNWERFYNRAHLIETIHGSFYFVTKRGKAVPRYISKDDVKSMIGLKTNASELTTKQFIKRFDTHQL